MYKIEFVDGTEFINDSDDLNNSRWKEIPDKPIYSLTYTLCGFTIHAAEYEAYNHCGEKNNLITIAGQCINSFINPVILMFKEKNMVSRVFIDVVKKTKIEDVVPFGKEYNNRPVTGWKSGIKVQ